MSKIKADPSRLLQRPSDHVGPGVAKRTATNADIEAWKSQNPTGSGRPPSRVFKCGYCHDWLIRKAFTNSGSVCDSCIEPAREARAMIEEEREAEREAERQAKLAAKPKKRDHPGIAKREARLEEKASANTKNVYQCQTCEGWKVMSDYPSGYSASCSTCLEVALEKGLTKELPGAMNATIDETKAEAIVEASRQIQALRDRERETRRLKKLASRVGKGQAVRQRAETAEMRQRLETERVREAMHPEAPPELNPAQRELMSRELARRSLLEFAYRFMPDYDAGWMHKLICQELEEFSRKVANGESPRLMFQMPPRAGKSQLVSDFFPSWHLGRNPSHDTIVASYAESLPLEFSKNVRDRLAEPSYQALFPACKLHSSYTNATGWRTNQQGTFTPVGVGGGLTGRGAHVLIVDDPIKNMEEAESENIREAIFRWYQSTAYTRLMPGGGVIICQCMTGDTSVSMADGTAKRLDEIAPGDMVLAWKDGEIVPRRVLNWAPQGEDDVYEIKTGNATVRANARHPFLFRSQKGKYKWVRVKDFETLGASNRMVHAAQFEFGRAASLTNDEAWLLGLMFGDGWVTERDAKNYDAARDTHYPRRGYVTCLAQKAARATTRRAVELFEALFAVTPKYTKFGYLRTEVAKVGRWFVERGLVGGAKGKRLPTFLFSEPAEVRKAFLDGFCAADGHVYTPKGAGKPRQQIGLASRELVEDIRRLARSLGFRVTNISEERTVSQPPNSPAPIESASYRISWAIPVVAAEHYARPQVRHVGREVVYDIQVEDAECFLADGLVSHNTRWHDDDLSGRLETKMLEGAGDEFKIIRFPAIAQEDEPYRKKGEALHPERFPVSALEGIKKSVGPRVWSALYQQNPVPDEGGFIDRKDIVYYKREDLPGELNYYATWDLAIGQKQHNDFTVGLCFGVDYDDNIWLVDMVRGRWQSLEIVDRIINFWVRYKQRDVGIEQGVLSHSIMPLLKKRIAEKRAYALHTVPLKPGKSDKVARARTIQGRIQQGKVMFPEDAPWAEVLLQELLRFPHGVHDDCVDALAYAGIMIQKAVKPMRKAAAPKKSWLDKLQLPTKRGGSFMSA